MNTNTKLLISGIDLFFDGYKSLGNKIYDILKNQDNVKSIELKKAVKEHPIYSQKIHCITIMFESELLVDFENQFNLMDYNKNTMEQIIINNKLNNIEYLGCEFYTNIKPTDRTWKEFLDVAREHYKDCKITAYRFC